MSNWYVLMLETLLKRYFSSFFHFFNINSSSLDKVVYADGRIIWSLQKNEKNEFHKEKNEEFIPKLTNISKKRKLKRRNPAKQIQKIQVQ